MGRAGSGEISKYKGTLCGTEEQTVDLFPMDAISGHTGYRITASLALSPLAICSILHTKLQYIHKYFKNDEPLVKFKEKSVKMSGHNLLL
jgi:hypothetical protein